MCLLCITLSDERWVNATSYVEERRAALLKWEQHVGLVDLASRIVQLRAEGAIKPPYSAALACVALDLPFGLTTTKLFS